MEKLIKEMTDGEISKCFSSKKLGLNNLNEHQDEYDKIINSKMFINSLKRDFGNMKLKV